VFPFIASAVVPTCFHSAPTEKSIAFTHILIISATPIVVAVPEGLLLAVILGLTFTTKRMTAGNLLVHILGSCETVANASVFRTDNTQTLTQHVISVVAGLIGIHAKYTHNLKENKAHTNAPDQEQHQPQEQEVTAATDEPRVNRKHADDFSIEWDDISAILSPQLRHFGVTSRTSSHRTNQSCRL